jgi:hypothetical protein
MTFQYQQFGLQSSAWLFLPQNYSDYAEIKKPFENKIKNWHHVCVGSGLCLFQKIMQYLLHLGIEICCINT